MQNRSPSPSDQHSCVPEVWSTGCLLSATGTRAAGKREVGYDSVKDGIGHNTVEYKRLRVRKEK